MQNIIRYIAIPGIIGALVGLAVIFLARDTTTGNPGYASAVRQAQPAVVNIYTTSITQPAICDIPRFRDWCENFQQRGGGRRSSSLGSGVIVREDGYIITNNHVVANADEVLVAFHNGQATTATLVGSDPETDLAVIKVAASDLPAIRTGKVTAVEVGDVALAIGNPFGFGQTVSAGIISAKGRMGITPSPYSDFLQTDAAINPGNSGGALINTQGELIGINTLIFSRSGGSSGIGFAIPVETALAVLEDLLDDGLVRRGWLGIELGASLPTGQGLRVNRVLQGGPAYRAGLRSGDLLLAVDGEPSTNATQASQQIAAADPGSQVVLNISRNNESLDLTATTALRPQTQ